MTIKILIIGFQRSGTTLLRRILQYHPNIIKCFHERWVLNNPKLYDNLDKYNWGEKIPWYGSSTKIIDYSNKWLKLFKNEARIIHIIRNSKDVAISNFKFKTLNKKSTKNKCEMSVSKLQKEFINNKYYKEISFEDLVTDPFKITTEIFKFCQLDNSEKTINEVISPGKDKWRYFNSIESSRALAHKNIKDSK